MTSATGQSLSGATPNGSHKTVNAWQQPGPAASDFRSDTITTPNISMLRAITNTTLMDDVFVEDPTTNDLQSYIASLTGHEEALLVMSGTMGNQVSLRTHLIQPPHSVLADARSHIIKYEAGGVSTLSNAMIIPVQPSNKHHLTLEDIQDNIIISSDIHACPTTVISLENTLNGMIMPLSEIERISTYARTNKVKLHLDGARLWEVSAATGVPISSFTKHFDSVSLCFSKGLGAPIGSMIVGSKPFITHARRIRKLLGGGTRQCGIISAAARVAVDENFGRRPDGSDGKLRATHERARRIAGVWTGLGGRLTWPVETNMVWLDLGGVACRDEEFVALAKEEGLKMLPRGRMVVHYQISDEAEAGLTRLMGRLAKMKGSETNGETTYSEGEDMAKKGFSYT